MIFLCEKFVWALHVGELKGKMQSSHCGTKLLSSPSS